MTGIEDQFNEVDELRRLSGRGRRKPISLLEHHNKMMEIAERVREAGYGSDLLLKSLTKYLSNYHHDSRFPTIRLLAGGSIFWRGCFFWKFWIS